MEGVDQIEDYDIQGGDEILYNLVQELSGEDSS
jgi:hypothetical protein